MECRAGCGACCIAPSITQPYHGMPEGKKAGERCIHLNINNMCDLFADPRRPQCCTVFQAEEWVCGNHFDEAIVILAKLEISTLGSIS
jgi:uncharacterized protein